MVSVELSTREGDGVAVAALRGELDVADAAKVAASLAAVTASGRDVIVDLERQEFIDSSGLAAPVRARRHARRARRDLMLALPQQQVLRMLAITRLINVFAVRASAEEAVGVAGCIPAAIAPDSGARAAGHGITDTLRAVRSRRRRLIQQPSTPAPPSGATAPNSQEGLK